jgi:hypothetical protein
MNIQKELTQPINSKPEKHFKHLANFLFDEVSLVAGRTSYRFTELEFYFFEESEHEDPYVHRHVLQKKSGTWYFHGSGLDITFGSEQQHGGILIRGLHRAEEPSFISGPLNVVTELFDKITPVDQIEQQFGLKHNPNKEKVKFYETKRIGLNKSKDNPFGFYYKKYRFISCLVPEHKFKDKEQTLVNLVEANAISKTEAERALGYNSSALKKLNQH